MPIEDIEAALQAKYATEMSEDNTTELTDIDKEVIYIVQRWLEQDREMVHKITDARNDQDTSSWLPAFQEAIYNHMHEHDPELALEDVQSAMTLSRLKAINILP